MIMCGLFLVVTVSNRRVHDRILYLKNTVGIIDIRYRYLCYQVLVSLVSHMGIGIIDIRYRYHRYQVSLSLISVSVSFVSGFGIVDARYRYHCYGISVSWISVSVSLISCIVSVSQIPATNSMHVLSMSDKKMTSIDITSVCT